MRTPGRRRAPAAPLAPVAPPAAAAALAPAALLAPAAVLAAVLALAALTAGCRERPIEAERTIPYDEAVALARGEPRPAGAGTAAATAERRRGAAAVGEPLLLYRHGERPCRLLMAGQAGVATGACGGRLARKLYSGPDRAERLRGFVERFAPFEIDVEGEELELLGRGTEEPTATERRMVLEWTRRLDQEAAGVPRNAAMGLAFAWHRTEPGGGCEDLAVYLTGEVRASACGDGTAAATAALPAADLERVYAWHDRYRPFQALTHEGGNGAGAGGRSSQRVLFAGGGEEPRGDELVAELAAFSARAYREAFADELRRAEEARLAEAQRAAAAAAAGPRPGVLESAVPPADPFAGTPEEVLPAPVQVGVAETEEGAEEEAVPGEEPGAGEAAGPGDEPAPEPPPEPPPETSAEEDAEDPGAS